MKKKTILTGSFLITALLSMQTVFSQDIRNAEINATPLAINPAFTGMFKGDLRAKYIVQKPMGFRLCSL